MERKIDPVEPCCFKGCNGLLIEKGAIGLERDGSYFLNFPDCRNELRKTVIHEGLSGRIDMALHTGALEAGDFLHRPEQVLHLDLIARSPGR